MAIKTQKISFLISNLKLLEFRLPGRKTGSFLLHKVTRMSGRIINSTACLFYMLVDGFYSTISVVFELGYLYVTQMSFA